MQEFKRPIVKVGYAAIFLFLAVLALICVLPIIWVFLSAFKTPAEMYKLNEAVLITEGNWVVFAACADNARAKEIIESIL